jgi:hypothetical protein
MKIPLKEIEKAHSLAGLALALGALAPALLCKINRLRNRIKKGNTEFT